MEKRRLYYLDNLKWMLIILVIFHHAGQAYGDGGDWAYQPSDPREYVEGLWRFFSLNAGFMMGLFFLISGYFTPRSFDKYGFGQFFYKRLKHIGLPLLFLCVFISSLSGNIDIAHGWYLLMLLVFSMGYAILRVTFSNSSAPIGYRMNSRYHLLILFCAVTLLATAEYCVRGIYNQDYWVGISHLRIFEPVHLPQYLLMYSLGIYSYRTRLFDEMTATTGITCIATSCAIAYMMFCVATSFNSCHWWLFESFFCISTSFGLIWLFRQFMNFTSKFTQWCASQEYGAYLSHLTNLLAMQVLFDKLYLGGGIPKLIFIGAATTVFTFITTAMTRRIPKVNKII